MARLAWLAGLILAAATPVLAQNSASLSSTSTYGNFHAGGVVVVIAGDLNGNASVGLEWRLAAGTFTWAHPLVRIDATRFVGSLFWLSPGSAYEVRVTFSDPDGVTGPATATAALATRPDTLPRAHAAHALRAPPPATTPTPAPTPPSRCAPSSAPRTSRRPETSSRSRRAFIARP